ncbi:hypothetical protein D9M71_569360 [compost metagenome]
MAIVFRRELSFRSPTECALEQPNGGAFVKTQVLKEVFVSNTQAVYEARAVGASHAYFDETGAYQRAIGGKVSPDCLWWVAEQG